GSGGCGSGCDSSGGWDSGDRVSGGFRFGSSGCDSRGCGVGFSGSGPRHQPRERGFVHRSGARFLV
ncbi:MAG: hypothetical protein AB1938_31655, partial [Myxococcota bacterium]